MILRLRRVCCLSLLFLGIVALGCGDSGAARQQVSASLDRIDVLIAKEEWDAVRSELKKTYETEIPRLSRSAAAAAHARMNAQTELLMAAMIEESRAELERTHTRIDELFATFDATVSHANQSCAGREVHVKGELGMLATDRFDRPYITLQSSGSDYSVQAVFLTKDRHHERLPQSGQPVFVTCTCDGRSGSVIVMSRCSLSAPSANGDVPTWKPAGVRKCGPPDRECA